jgi:glycosyltransferase involved in cell wall biosynthesis
MSSIVRIGIPVRERADLLTATLHSLRAHSKTATVVLLGDGTDRATRDTINESHCESDVWDTTRGDAHAFNRLVAGGSADFYVLLENGARVTPLWLERLLEALAASSTHGIAGPSTNRAWNEQQIFPGCSGDEPALSRAALEASARFGTAWATLEPLHSLGDFCYVASRAVVERIGAADEGYGEGPCWEMDYNIRAARAGFAGVWAKSAFVWRAPPTQRRLSAEARRLGANKRRYQDRFCGLRLQGTTTQYDSHCTGEVCPHFAPGDLIETRLEPGAPISTRRRACSANSPRTEVTVSDADTAQPLVSCIMPTANRRPFVPHAIAAFLRQDYANRELIIVDDGADSIEDLIPADPRIRYVRIASGKSLGNKRNEACRLARGTLIAHWDDDDWHAAWRLSYQVRELLARRADLCGLDRMWFYDPVRKQAWQYRYPGSRTNWLAGGSFCYRRELWERQRFNDVRVGEDTRYVREASFAKIVALERDDFYVARVHAGNTCAKQTSGSSWFAAPVHTIEALVANIEAATPAETNQSPSSAPLISCIMPTRNRRALVPFALSQFARQDYPNLELIVIDDGDDAVSDLMPADERIRYVHPQRALTLGAKRNLGCELASGEIVVHWDDDDWYGAGRLSAQAAPILGGSADVSALSMALVLDLTDMRFWRCRPAHHARVHYRDLCPGTMAFNRSLWLRGARYAPVRCAEDVAFLKSLPASTRITRLPEDHHFVCVRHAGNTWPIPLDWRRSPQGWEAIDRPPFVRESDFSFYLQSARRAAAARGV